MGLTAFWPLSRKQGMTRKAISLGLLALSISSLNVSAKWTPENYVMYLSKNASFAMDQSTVPFALQMMEADRFSSNISVWEMKNTLFCTSHKKFLVNVVRMCEILVAFEDHPTTFPLSRAISTIFHLLNQRALSEVVVLPHRAHHLRCNIEVVFGGCFASHSA